VTAGKAHRLHREVDSARWCVNREDLVVFEQEVYALWLKGGIPKSSYCDASNHDDPKIGPSIHQVCEHYIKPVTLEAGGMSWALMRHPEGLTCDVFATHCWAEGVFEFLSKVRDAWPVDHEAKGLYCCFLANPQNGGIEDMLNDGPDRSPFAQALNTAKHFLVIPNSKVSIYSRLWCVYEAHLAVEAASKGTLNIMLPSTVPHCAVITFSLPGVLSFLLGLILAYFFCAAFYGFVFQPLVWMVLVMIGSPLLGGSMRCLARYAHSKVAAWATLSSYWLELFIIGHGLGLAFWHFRGFNDQYVAGRRVSHSFEIGEGWACLPLAFSLVVLYLSIIIRRVSRSIAQREAHMLNFTSVRHAKCTRGDDELRIWRAIQGQEDHIDRCIEILSHAGKYDKALLRNIANGMSPLQARLGANPFRIFIAVWAWEYWWVTDLAAHAHHIYCIQAPAATCALALIAWYFVRDHAVFAFDMLFFGGLLFVAVSKLWLNSLPDPRAGDDETPQRFLSWETLAMQLLGLCLVVVASLYHYCGLRKTVWGERGSCSALGVGQSHCLLTCCDEDDALQAELANIGEEIVDEFALGGRLCPADSSDEETTEQETTTLLEEDEALARVQP